MAKAKYYEQEVHAMGDTTKERKKSKTKQNKTKQSKTKQNKEKQKKTKKKKKKNTKKKKKKKKKHLQALCQNTDPRDSNIF